MDNATKALARMNMILHDCPTAEIWQDNTLATPYFKEPDGRLKTFDFVVANFPFSTKEVEVLAARVDEHLKKMGAVWS